VDAAIRDGKSSVVFGRFGGRGYLAFDCSGGLSLGKDSVRSESDTAHFVRQASVVTAGYRPRTQTVALSRSAMGRAEERQTVCPVTRDRNSTLMAPWAKPWQKGSLVAAAGSPGCTLAATASSPAVFGDRSGLCRRARRRGQQGYARRMSLLSLRFNTCLPYGRSYNFLGLTPRGAMVRADDLLRR